MTNVIFEVVVKAGALFFAIILFVCWLNAGCPFVTISRNKK